MLSSNTLQIIHWLATNLKPFLVFNNVDNFPYKGKVDMFSLRICEYCT